MQPRLLLTQHFPAVAAEFSCDAACVVEAAIQPCRFQCISNLMSSLFLSQWNWGLKAADAKETKSDSFGQIAMFQVRKIRP